MTNKSRNNIVAFIPVRGGSKSIPLKNIRPFCGKPLVYWVISAAQGCGSIDRIYVSTDSPKIKKTVEKFGFSKVQVIGRSKKSASDKASTESAMIEFAKRHEFKHIVLIQATSPLLTARDLSGGITKFIRQRSDSLLSVVRQFRFIWAQKGGLVHPLNYDPFKRPRRQDWNGFLMENGAFYITGRDRLLRTKCRISGRTAIYEMKSETAYELDEPSDWGIMEGLKRRSIAGGKIV